MTALLDSALSWVLLKKPICRELIFDICVVVSTDKKVVERVFMSAELMLAMPAVESVCIASVVRLFKLLPILTSGNLMN